MGQAIDLIAAVCVLAGKRAGSGASGPRCSRLRDTPGVKQRPEQSGATRAWLDRVQRPEAVQEARYPRGTRAAKYRSAFAVIDRGAEAGRPATLGVVPAGPRVFDTSLGTEDGGGALGMACRGDRGTG
ncbi:hypothetical protein GCM10017687_03840 [Streptomyces echinatus]